MEEEYEQLVVRLRQANVHPLERAEACARAKDLYESMHPGARRGGAGRAAASLRTSTAAQTVSKTVWGFCRAFSIATGFSESAIYRDARIGAALLEELREVLREASRMPASQGELLALAKLDADEQRAVLARLLEAPTKPATWALSTTLRKIEPPPIETDFTRHVLLALGARRDLRVWRQNVGSVPVRDRAGNVVRIFDAGPPKGAADITGVVGPEGWRLELELKSAAGKLAEAQRAWRHTVGVLMGALYVHYTYDRGVSLDENVGLVVRAVDHEINQRRA